LIRDDSGEIIEWEITGTKQFISNGGYADFMTVLAATEEGPSFFIVENTYPGFKPGKHEEKHGIRCSNTSPLVFDKVRVPAENLIGNKPGEGLKQANAVFGYTRLMVAAFGLGAGIEALERAVRYAKERIQFGSPLIDKPGYTHKLIIPNWVNMEAARAYIESASTMIDNGMTDNEVEGSIAKYFATETGNQAAEQAIQAFGGYGYIHEYEVEKIKRDVRITTIYEGTSEIQQMIIGTYRWRTTIRKKGAFYQGIADELEATHEKKPELAADLIAQATRTLNSLILTLHKARIMKHQHVLFTMADLMTRIEVGAALVQKAANPEKPESKAARRVELSARIFAIETMNLIRSKAEFLLLGTGAFSAEDGNALLDELQLDAKKANLNAIHDMDELVKLL
ncbi:acyl-CoA dehydrogenase, partial [bacterium]|nr:acyl-CoA dehydrogenase [bacterium]